MTFNNNLKHDNVAFVSVSIQYLFIYLLKNTFINTDITKQLNYIVL